MKTLLYACVALQLFCYGILFPQTSRDASRYFNKIYGLWNAAQYDSAVDYSLKLVKLNPSMFGIQVHEELSQGILSAKSHHNASAFVNRLYLTNNREIIQIVAPIHALNSIVETNNKDSVLSLVRFFLSLLSNTSNYSSKAESYGLLILKQMDSKGIHDVALKRKLIEKVIHNTKANRSVDSTSVQGRHAEEQRAWNRYVLSYGYFLLYQLDPDGRNAEGNLKLAAKYSPDNTDKQVHDAYFYEAGLLNPNTEEIGFEWLYVDFLMRKNRKNEALFVAARKAVTEATNANCSRLQALYKEGGYNKPFAKYWVEAINNASKVAPAITVKFTDGKTISFGKPGGSWTYIDVWGTWCSSCIKELPGLETVYRDNLAKSEHVLSIFTFSRGSKDLNNFMTTNKYTFPVAEIDSSVIRAFHVESWPTKILLTPQGKYLKIPWGVEWQEYLMNYCMLKE
jgi:hypothetical protein